MFSKLKYRLVCGLYIDWAGGFSITATYRPTKSWG